MASWGCLGVRYSRFQREGTFSCTNLTVIGVVRWNTWFTGVCVSAGLRGTLGGWREMGSSKRQVKRRPNLFTCWLVLSNTAYAWQWNSWFCSDSIWTKCPLSLSCFLPPLFLIFTLSAFLPCCLHSCLLSSFSVMDSTCSWVAGGRDG